MGAADKEEVQAINDTIKILSESLKETSAYAPFIYCKIGDLELATSNIDSKSNYLMSLNHVKTGTGRANQFTLNVAYIPELLSLNSSGQFSLLDMNQLDLLDIDLIGKEIEFSYGYCFPSAARRDADSNLVRLDSRYPMEI